MGAYGVASVEEVRNLADNWCHDNLTPEHYTPQDVTWKATAAYTAGYDQAITDVRDELG